MLSSGTQLVSYSSGEPHAIDNPLTERVSTACVLIMTFSIEGLVPQALRKYLGPIFRVFGSSVVPDHLPLPLSYTFCPENILNKSDAS